MGSRKYYYYRRPIRDLLKTYRRPIADPSETHWRPTCLMGDLSETLTCFIRDPSEMNMPQDIVPKYINKLKVYKKKNIQMC